MKAIFNLFALALFGLTLTINSTHVAKADAIESLDQKITRTRILRGPLVWVGKTAPSAKESEKLWEAVSAFKARDHSEGIAAIEGFLKAYTNSPWAPSLRALLGVYYRESGRYTPALDHWEKAWIETKEAQSGTAREVADFTIVHWTRLLASLGRVDTLKELFKEAGGRTMDAGPLLQQFLSTQEGFRTMVANSGVSYRCGNSALYSVAGVLRPTNDFSRLLLLNSPATGFSVADLTRLSGKHGLDLVAVRRERGDDLIVPCVVHWKQNHYAAVTQQRGDLLHIIDPTFGRPQWLSKSAVNSEVSGVFLVPRHRVPEHWTTVPEQEAESIFGKGYPTGIEDNDDEPCIACPCPPGSGGPGGRGPGGGGGGKYTSGANPFWGGGGGCDTCGGRRDVIDRPTGMPQWRVSEPYITLWVVDEPLGYDPARGNRVSFQLAYKQRDQVVREPIWFSVGKLWNSSWLGYIEQFEGDDVLYVPGGGKRHYGEGYYYNVTTVEPNSNTRLERMTNGSGALTGFKVLYPSGAMDLYTHFVITARTNAFLTGIVSTSGHTNRFEYTNYSSGAVRLLRIIDAQNQTNWVHYATNHPHSSNLIARVVDPFGRETRLDYHINGWLTNITDVAGLSTSFSYDTNNGWMTNMTTPYEATRFELAHWFEEPDAYTLPNYPGTNNRSALITLPNGSKELYIYRAYSSWLPTTYPDLPYGDNEPSGDDLPSPFWYTIVPDGHEYRNTFYWNRQQFAVLSENAKTNTSNLSSNDFRMGRLRHWLHEKGTSGKISRALAIEQQPSPTLSSVVDGQRTWYGHDGQSGRFAGTTLLPNIIALKPNNEPGAPARFTYNEYRRYQDYMLTNVVTSYAGADGGRLMRTNKFIYAANDVDLLQVIGPSGETEMQYGYNSNHQVTGETNAIGYWTAYAYNGSRQLTNVTRSSGLTTTYAYDANGYLTNIADVEIGRTASFTYANGLVQTRTDSLGSTITNTWDALQRLVASSDGRGYISNVYTKLDLTASRDRLGNWRYSTYNALRQLTGQTNELGHATVYSYCECGGPDAISDPLTNTTSYAYDYNGRVIRVAYPGGSSVTNKYDLLGQLINVTDSAGNSTTNWYNHHGLLVAVSNAFGRVYSAIYDIEDRATNTVDANGITVVTTYDDLGRALSRTYPDTGVEKFQYSARGLIGVTNQLGFVTKYTYDAAGRKIGETNANNEVTQFKHDPSGNLTNLIDGKSQNTFWKYDLYGRMTNKIDHTGADMFRYVYDANNRLTNRWTPAKTNTFYAYDAVGNLTNIDYVVSTDIRMAYDANNRLTNIVDALGVTKYSYTEFGAVLSEDGPWENDTVSYAYDNALRRNNMTLLHPNSSPCTQTYAHDAARRLTNVTSGAGTFAYAYKNGTPGSLIRKVLFPNGASVTNDFDSMGRLLATHLRNSSDALLNKHEYIYNAGSQRTRQTFTQGNYVDYTYDDIGQLKTALGSESGGVTNRWHEQFRYAYDAAGNLTNRIQNRLTNGFTLNSLNQLTAGSRDGKFTVAGTTTSPATNVTVNGGSAALYVDSTFASTNHSLSDGTNTFSAVAKDNLGRTDTNIAIACLPAAPAFAYDSNGNLVTNGTRLLEYDDENQLVRVTEPNAWKTELVYDGKKRLRVSLDFTWQNGVWVLTNEVRRVYDGNLVLQERDNFNLPQVTYTRGVDLSGTLEGAGGIGGLLSRTDYRGLITGDSYYHSDGGGNVTALFTGQIVWGRYLYDPFGNVLSMSGSIADANTYRFSSKETVAGLICYLYRYYDPSLQRWINRDPLQELGGQNLYAFANNNPVSRVDPFGLLAPPPPTVTCHPVVTYVYVIGIAIAVILDICLPNPEEVTPIKREKFCGEETGDCELIHREPIGEWCIYECPSPAGPYFGKVKVAFPGAKCPKKASSDDVKPLEPDGQKTP